MSKELIVSVTPQENKASILENDQVVEIHIERNQEHGLVGSIFRGKVTKVLPGMQSAFVDIGLERDSFLYVSDFFEDTEEYDKIVTTAEDQVAKFEQGGKEPAPSVSESTLPSPEGTTPAANVLKYQDRRGRSRRSRRNRLRSKRFDETAPLTSESPATIPETLKTQEPQAEEQTVEEAEYPAILPGESLAKYQRFQVSVPNPETGSSLIDLAALPASGDISMTAEDEDSIQESEVTESATDDLENEDEGELDMEEAASVEDLPLEKERVSILAEPVKKGKEASSDLALSSEDGDSGRTQELTSEVDASRLTTAISSIEETSIPSEEPGYVRLVETADAAGESSTASLLEGQRSSAPAEEVAVPLTTADSLLIKTPEAAISKPVSPTEPAAGSPTVSPQAQFRNTPPPPRFFRKNLDRRRRPHPSPEDRKELNGSPNVPLIGDLLKEGQEILVQISKEPLGTKGARITSHIALPGRYLVYMPTVDHIGVSRKIDSDEERLRLKRIIQENRRNLPGGFIVRTAGEGKGEEEFKSDIRFLSALWAEIKSKSERKSAPAMIHRDLNLVQRLLRDQLSGDFGAIRVDNETEYASILEFMNRFQPSMVSRVKLYTKDTPIFEEFGVQTEIDRALKSKVWLKSGGYIVIDQAEALVAIDVNTGKYVGKSNKLEDTIVKTNMEAAREIARQIRLRDLGGIIVCDFIDMEDRKNRQKVTQTLEEALRADKSPSKVLQFNDFGLVAITRKRVKQSLLKTLCEPCPHCSGAGMVKSPQTVCYEIQAEVKKMARSLEDNQEITIRVNPEVARALKTDEASVVNEIESLFKKEVLIKSDPLLHQEHFDIF